MHRYKENEVKATSQVCFKNKGLFKDKCRQTSEEYATPFFILLATKIEP